MEMNEETCPKRIRAWQLDDGVFQCKLPAGHRDDEHMAPGLYMYQTVTWFAGDRREFEGEFVKCDYEGCRLPTGHRGGHSI